MNITNNKRIIRAWTMYDWANSVYNLVITSTIFPIYYSKVTSSPNSDIVNFLGFQFVNTSLYAYAISFSFLITALLSPLLSSIADYSGTKKGFMKTYTWMGAIACSLLFFFTGENIEFGIIMFVIASIGYSGSLVFYNAYLPEIASADKQDKVSARGFALGYIGSSILLIFNLMMILNPTWFGIEQSGLPARISFLTVGVWWIGFAAYSFYYLPKNVFNKKPKGHYLLNGYRELQIVWKQIKKLNRIKYYLFAFFFYTMGVQTVMYVAALFGEKELKLESGQLIMTILIIQFVGMAGAFLFAFLSKRSGNIRALIIAIIIWIGICIGAYYVYNVIQFYVIAFCVGMVMGGIQALSRSTYSKLLPETEDHTSFFSFFDVTEKIAIVLGTASYGLIEQLTGSMRNSIVALTSFFIIGLFLLGSKFRKGFKLEIK